jgi:hypothetical protein
VGEGFGGRGRKGGREGGREGEKGAVIERKRDIKKVS